MLLLITKVGVEKIDRELTRDEVQAVVDYRLIVCRAKDGTFEYMNPNYSPWDMRSWIGVERFCFLQPIRS